MLYTATEPFQQIHQLSTKNYNMRIAIHHRPCSYSELWIEYCQRHNIQYKIVDAYANDIIEQVADCNAFMWHHHLHQYKDYLFAKQLIYIIEKQMGKVTYPDFDTCWHYDDKIGQKYLLSAIGAPLIPTYIFYNRQDALVWIKQTTFPKVFKLRSGASATNVHLVSSLKDAQRLVKQAFGVGFEKNNYFRWLADRWAQYKRGGCNFRWLIRGLFTFYPYKERFHKEEMGYVYFQDFIPNNNFDIRVLIIGNRAVAKKRMNRPNDFRASGSGNLIFDKEEIDIKFIKAAFETNRNLKMHSVAFDFLLNQSGEPVISEISYCCGIKSNKDYPGYWTPDLQWHDCSDINICDWIMEDVISKIKNQ